MNDLGAHRHWRPRLPGGLRLGLRLRIAALVAVAVVALAALLGGIIGAASVDQVRQRSGLGVANDAGRLAERLNKEMAARSREIELIGALDPVHALPGAPGQAPVVAAMLDRLQFLFPAYVWIGVTDPHGRVLAATGGALVGRDISACASLANVLSARGGSQEDSTQSARPLLPDGSGRVVDIVHPVTDGQGVVVDILFAQIRWSWIEELAASVMDLDDANPGQDGREAFLVASDNTVLLGPPGVVNRKLFLPPMARARAGYAGWDVQTWPDEQKYLTGYAYAAGEGAYPGPGSQKMQWAVLVRQPVATAFGPASRLRDDILLAGAVLAVIFAGLGWLAAGWISAPLVRMAACAERLRDGEDVEMPLLGGAFEIESLSVSLRAMVAALTDKQMALRQMETLTTHDALTGVFNRSGLRKYLDMAMAERAQGCLLLFLGDLDGFKEVNDQLGHAAGDGVLCEVAARLNACLRQGDGVARFGGDEFAMVLLADRPDDDVALRVAERMLADIAKPCQMGRDAAQVGISIGGAVWQPGGIGIDEVIRRADLALYASKHAGKGRLTMYETMTPGGQ